MRWHGKIWFYDLNGSSFIHTPREHWLMAENSHTHRNIVNKLGSDERRIPPPQMIGTCISTLPRRRKSAQAIFGFHLSWLWFWDTHGHSWKIPECLTIASSPNVWIRSTNRIVSTRHSTQWIVITESLEYHLMFCCFSVEPMVEF